MAKKTQDKAPTPQSRVLKVPQKPGMTLERALTDVASEGLASNASVIVGFARQEFGEMSLSDMVDSLKAQGAAVNSGDMRQAEQLLSAQALTLNAIFAELARRALVNMGDYLDATDRYMRLALKAQSQSRATLETLGNIKNPPVVYAKQANITNGPQQVNNGAGAFLDASAHGKTESGQPKLLESQHGSTTLDAGATTTAARSNREVEAVGEVHRAED